MQKEINNNPYTIIKIIVIACIPVFASCCLVYLLHSGKIVPSNFDFYAKKEIPATIPPQNTQKLDVPDNISEEIRQSVTFSLERAILLNDLELVQNYINQGADVNAKDTLGNPYLYLAAHHAKPEIVKILLENGANANAKNGSGHTPLHFATNPEIVKMLIKNGADVNAKNDVGETPVKYTSDTEIIKLLKDAGAKLDIKSSLYPLVVSNNYILLKEMLDAGADINAKDENGQAPLFWTIHPKNLDMAKFLLENGADVNIKDDYGATPLMFASSSRNPEMTEFLLKKGADVNAKSKDGYTALQTLVFSYGDYRSPVKYDEKSTAEIAKLLLDADADANLKRKRFNNEQEMSPLHYAMLIGSAEIAKVLVEGGANVNEQDYFGVTPLMWASASGYTDIVKLLIEKGADVNIKDQGGLTALFQAKAKNNEEIANILIQAGAKE